MSEGTRLRRCGRARPEDARGDLLPGQPRVCPAAPIKSCASRFPFLAVSESPNSHMWKQNSTGLHGLVKLCMEKQLQAKQSYLPVDMEHTIVKNKIQMSKCKDLTFLVQ